MGKDDAANVFGRLTALEMISTNFLTMTLGGGTPKPLTALDEMRQMMCRNTHNAVSPISEFQDQCWGEAVAALEQLFENTRERLMGLGFRE